MTDLQLSLFAIAFFAVLMTAIFALTNRFSSRQRCWTCRRVFKLSDMRCVSVLFDSTDRHWFCLNCHRQSERDGE